MPSSTVLRNELNFLRSLELIDGSGHGAGARWWLRSTHGQIERNRTEWNGMERNRTGPSEAEVSRTVNHCRLSELSVPLLILFEQEGAGVRNVFLN
jgi:hypothetical protein